MSKPIASFDERAVKDELRELVGKTIEEAINAMLDEEVDRFVGAGPYERATSAPRTAPATANAASPRHRARSRSRRPS